MHACIKPLHICVYRKEGLFGVFKDKGGYSYKFEIEKRLKGRRGKSKF